MGSCYKLRAYYSSQGYISHMGTYAYTSRYSRRNVWRIVKGIDGTRNSITLKDRRNRYGMMTSGYRARFYWNKDLKKTRSAFYVMKGLAGRGISLMPTRKYGYFLRDSSTRSYSTKMRVSRYKRRWSFKTSATWIPIKTRC